MKVITLANEKGGVGKTTQAIHLATGLAIRGQRVLLIDADAQANATFALGLKYEPCVYDLLVREAAWKDVLRIIPPEVYESPFEKSKGILAVLPGNDETGFLAQKLRDALLINTRLKELTDFFDVVIFDTSPTPSLLHGIIYLATDAIVYPTICETFSLNGLVSTIRNLEVFSAQRAAETGRPVINAGIIPNMYRGKTVEHDENLKMLKERFGSLVMPPVSMSIAWSEAAGLRRPIFAVAPNSNAAAEAWQVVDSVERVLSHVFK